MNHVTNGREGLDILWMGDIRITKLSFPFSIIFRFSFPVFLYFSLVSFSTTWMFSFYSSYAHLSTTLISTIPNDYSTTKTRSSFSLVNGHLILALATTKLQPKASALPCIIPPPSYHQFGIRHSWLYNHLPWYFNFCIQLRMWENCRQWTTSSSCRMRAQISLLVCGFLHPSNTKVLPRNRCYELCNGTFDIKFCRL